MAGKGNPNISEFGKATRFQPGKSGNPGGASSRVSITRLVREELQKPCSEGSPVTKAEMVAAKLVGLATTGSPWATPLVWRYIDGDPKDSLQVELDEMIANVARQYGLDPAKVRERFLRDTGLAS